MSSNINIYLLKNQKNIFDQYKAAFGESFAEKDLVTIENNTSSVSNLKNVSKVVFEYIYACALNGRGIWMAHETLAIKLGYCVTSIKNALNYLQSLGLVSWVSGKKNYTTNQYYVHISLLAHEAIRILKDYLQCAWLAWCRRLIRFSVNFSILSGIIPTSVNNDSDRKCLPRNKKLYINKSYRINRISIVEGIREKKNDERKKIGNVMNEERKVVFEALERKGLRFNKPAQAELSMFNDGTLLTTGARYVVAAKKSTISNPWGYFITIAKQIATENGHSIDRVYASTIRTKMGISDTDKRTLEYTPVASDNTEHSLKKVGDSGKLTDSIPDENGWVKGIMKDERKVQSRAYQNDFRKHARNPVDIPVFEAANPKRDYANPGESPQAIRMNMMNYSQSQAYQIDCERSGKEHTDAQINLWLKVANLEEAGNYDKANEIRGEILINSAPKLAIFKKIL